MKKLIATLLLLPSLVFGDVLTATWTPPSALEDGSSLLAEEIQGYAVKYSIDNGQEILVDVGLSATFELEATPGIWAISVATITDWSTGQFSPVATVEVGEIEKSDPLPPTNITFSIQCDTVTDKCSMEIIR